MALSPSAESMRTLRLSRVSRISRVVRGRPYDAAMTRTDTAARIIAASPDLVYDALVNPEALVAWLPPSGMTGRMDYFDARAGGSYRMELTYSDPSAQGKSTADTDVVEVRYVELRPGVRVVQAVDFVSDDPSFPE